MMATSARTLTVGADKISVAAKRSHADEGTANVSPTVPESGGKWQRLENGRTGSQTDPAFDAASRAASAAPPAGEPASIEPSSKAELPLSPPSCLAASAAPSSAAAAASSDEAPAAVQAAVAHSPAKQASVGVGKPAAEPEGKVDRTQCQRHPLCKRGFNHGGKGGRCSFNEECDRRPSNSGSAARRPSAVVDSSPTDAPAEPGARAAAPEQQGTRSLQPIVNADTHGGELPLPLNPNPNPNPNPNQVHVRRGQRRGGRRRAAARRDGLGDRQEAAELEGLRRQHGVRGDQGGLLGLLVPEHLRCAR